MSACIDLTNERFDRLAVMSRGPNNKYNKAQWWCLCDCGQGVLVVAGSLKSSLTKSCGCLNKEQLSARVGEKHPMFGKMSGKDNPMYGVRRYGPSSFNWKGGISGERNLVMSHTDYKDWRKVVYARDEYTCQKCGKQTSGTLNAHHIEAFAGNPKLRTEVSNGVTLCQDCHRNLHHQYGQVCTRADWDDFIKE